jgi:hypothetical protein
VALVKVKTVNPPEVCEVGEQVTPATAFVDVVATPSQYALTDRI